MPSLPPQGHLAALIRASRLPFLGLSMASLFLGLALVAESGVGVDVSRLVLGTTAALLAHLGVNLLNEFADFRSGLDLRTRRTPFSGGSGALPGFPRAQRGVLMAGMAALGSCALIGLHLASLSSPWLVPIGLVGLALAAGYTPWITRRPWLCLIAPGLGIGLVMVTGLMLAMTGQLPTKALLLALVPFALANSVLLLNQLPDRDADRQAGRRNLVILYGPAAAGRAGVLLAALAAAAVITSVALHHLPGIGLLVLMPIALSAQAARRAAACWASPELLVPWLGWNIAAAHLAPVLLGLVLIVAAV